MLGDEWKCAGYEFQDVSLRGRQSTEGFSFKYCDYWTKSNSKQDLSETLRLPNFARARKEDDG